MTTKKSKVYFTDFHTPYGGPTMLKKLHNLLIKAGMDKINFKNIYKNIQKIKESNL